jgi:hypothetical protein
MGKFSVRFDEQIEKKLKTVNGNTKNAKLIHLVENYKTWIDKIAGLEKEIQKKALTIDEMNHAIYTKVQADHSLAECMRKYNKR